MSEYRYDAFISYRHGGVDQQVATLLHRKLETYGIPGAVQKSSGRKKMGKVFRDQEELPTSTDLGADIEDALRASQWLIVVCSPRLLQSRWCLREVETFIELGRRDHILTLLIEGEPDASFPRQLRFVTLEDGTTVEKEPLAADIRGASWPEVKKKLKIEKLRLLAPILGVSFDDLRRRARERFLRNVLAVALAVAVLATTFGSYAITQALRLAEANRVITAASQQIAQQRDAALLTQSGIVTSLARQEYEQNENNDSVKLALLAVLPENLEQPERPLYGDAAGLLRTMELSTTQDDDSYHVKRSFTDHVRMRNDGLIETWTELEQVQRLAGDRWLTPTQYNFLTPDWRLALDQDVYAPEDPALPEPGAIYTLQYHEVSAFDYEKKQLINTFRPCPLQGTYNLYAKDNLAVAWLTDRQSYDGVLTVWEVNTNQRLFTLLAYTPDDFDAIWRPPLPFTTEEDGVRPENWLAAVQDQAPNPLEGTVVILPGTAAESNRRRISQAFLNAGNSLVIVYRGIINPEGAERDASPHIQAFSLATGELVWDIPDVILDAWSNDGALLSAHPALSGEEIVYEKLLVYDTAKGSLLAEYEGKGSLDCAFAAASRQVFVAENGALRRHALGEAESTAIPLPYPVEYGALSVSDDGRTLLINESILVERGLPGIAGIWPGYVGGTKSGDEGLLFLYPVGFERVDIFNSDDLTPVSSLPLRPSEDGLPAYDLPVVSHDGSRLFYRGYIYDVASGGVLGCVPLGAAVKDKFQALGFSTDNRRFFTWRETYNEVEGKVANLCEIRSYDAANGELLGVLTDDMLSMNEFNVRFREGALYLENGYPVERKISVFDTENGRLLRELRFPDAEYVFSNWSQDMSLLAVTKGLESEGVYEICVLDARTGEERLRARLPYYKTSKPVAFKDNGVIYAMTGDSVLSIDLASGQITGTVLSGGAEDSLAVRGLGELSSDGDWFVTYANEIWRLSDGSRFARVSRFADRPYELLGSGWLVVYTSPESAWCLGDEARETAAAVRIYRLRSDSEVIEAARKEMAGQALSAGEKKAYHLE